MTAQAPMQPTDRQLDFLWEEISTGNGVLFVGAGVSAGRFPRWQQLIDRLGDEFGISDQGGDTLDVPQWVVEAHGRAALEQRMVQVFHDPSKEPTPLQRLLARYPFDVVFTTNFDRLTERALRAQARQVNVVVEDSQVGRIRTDDRVTLVKMHGCVSAPDTIVVARDDYETYAQRHPAIVTYLQSLLATRTFLFVGFSLTDPNFRAIYSTVQHVLGAYRRFAFAAMLETGDNPHLWRYWYRKRLILIPLPGSDDVHAFLATGLDTVNKRVERRTNLYTILAALEQKEGYVGEAVRQLAAGLSHLAEGVRLQDQSPDFGVSWGDYTADERQRVYALHNFLTLMARIGLRVSVTLWLRLGNTLYALKKWPLAVEAYQAARRDWDRASGGVQERHVLRYAQGNLARCYIALADRRRRDEGVQLDDRMASEQVEYGWAESLLREIILDPHGTEPALDWEWLAVRPPDLEEHAYVTNRLAEAAIARERLAQAMRLLQRSIAWQEQGIEPVYKAHLSGPPLAYALNNLAKSYRLLTEIRWAQGAFEAAQESLAQALAHCAQAVEADADLPFPYGHVCALLGQARRYPSGDWSTERAIWRERIETQAARPGTVLDVGRLRREWPEFWRVV